ncbi:MAG: hemerythrin domain-containing protein [FCB group bacterium]|nr:hemerythrin domain-containing protein [FCB group bacterium]
MKRFPELRKLSDDHHQGLVLARHARVAGDAPSAVRVWQEVEEKFRLELNPHFIVEEKYLAPPLEALGEKELVKRFYSDHRELRAFINDTKNRTIAALNAFGDLLEAHIRFEERELFEVAQARLPAATLKAVEKAAANTAV